MIIFTIVGRLKFTTRVKKLRIWSLNWQGLLNLSAAPVGKREQHLAALSSPVEKVTIYLVH